MTSPQDFLRLPHFAGDPKTLLDSADRVRVLQDGNCVCCEVEQSGQRLFIKWAAKQASVRSLRQAIAINSAVKHAALARLLNVIETPTTPVLVFEWLHGQPLRRQQGDGGARFRALPMADQLAAVATLFDLHDLIAGAGFIAVDLYDGTLFYDFDQRRLRVFDLDEYRAGPFTLDADRLPGSMRFMAPEEFIRGALIDQVTNVFTLGRAAMVLLGDVEGTAGSWRGPTRGLEVVRRATSTQRVDRQPTVRQFVAEWTRVTARPS